MSISHIAQTISESATLKLNQTAAAMQAKGEPLIHLGGGEPKSKAPLEALVAVANLLESAEVRYTPAGGILPLKQAIVRYTEEFYGHTVTPANVIASGGAKQSIMVALQAILNPQDELIFTVPYWVSYPEMAKLCAAVPVPVVPKDGSFYPSIRDLESKMGPRTRAVMLNSPNNPSGAMYSEQFIAETVELCEKRDVYLIMDDIYHRLIFDGRQPVSSYKYAKKTGDDSKLIVVNGVSKQYAMTGFRIGWAVANKALIKVMTNIQGHQTSGPSVVMQQAALAALNGPQASVAALRTTLENNRNVMMERLQSFAGVRVTKPDGTFYCFADFSAFDKSSARLADLLLNKVLVAVMPGIEFGMDGYLRLSYCGTIKDITEGIERINWALDPSAPKELYLGDRKLVRDWL
ncbi:MAG TPA: pyridoxal phosphate-dependent aminotransferase [Phycisphaerae bacterium]|nr:pyridoxal phosphate-dependent aminotransferase [Phycisphaerae bacterium]HNU43864.1 pyridoxal phosphate-dependent aminotransferase [Phycisphaerae bacterium]